MEMPLMQQVQQLQPTGSTIETILYVLGTLSIWRGGEFGFSKWVSKKNGAKPQKEFDKETHDELCHLRLEIITSALVRIEAKLDKEN